jgi:hypothetical protein
MCGVEKVFGWTCGCGVEKILGWACGKLGRKILRREVRATVGPSVRGFE